MTSGLRQAIFFVLLMGVTAVGYQYMIRPANQDLAEAKRRVEGKRAKLADFEEATAQAEDFNKQVAAYRQLLARDQPEDRGLAGAVGADQPDLLAAVHRGRGLEEEDLRAVPLRDGVDPDLRGRTSHSSRLALRVQGGFFAPGCDRGIYKAGTLC